MVDKELEELYKIFEGKTLKQNVQDIVARYGTGYTYEELKSDEEFADFDPQEELQSVDKTVNILSHLYIAHIKAQLNNERIEG